MTESPPSSESGKRSEVHHLDRGGVPFVVALVLGVASVAIARWGLIALGLALERGLRSRGALSLMAPAAGLIGALFGLILVGYGLRRARATRLPLVLGVCGAAAWMAPDYLDTIPARSAYDLHGVLTNVPSQQWTDNNPHRPRIEYRINRLGLRGADFDEQKKPGVLRVALIGDSFLFGLGVEEHETLKAHLDAIMRARGLDGRVEILNLGVCGTNLPSHLGLYEVARRHLAADVVVEGLFLWNDLSTWDMQDVLEGSSRVGAYSLLAWLIGREPANALTTSLFVQHGLPWLSLRALDRLLPEWQRLREPVEESPPIVVLAFGDQPAVRERFERVPNTRYLVAPADPANYLPRDGHPTAAGNHAFAVEVMAALEGLAAFRAVSGGARLDQYRMRACPEEDAPLGCARLIAGGRFRRGAQAVDPTAPNFDPEAAPDEAPVRDIEISPFWLQAFEVTAGDYQDCIRAGMCRREDVKKGGYASIDAGGRHLFPATGMTWRGASDYCRFIGGRLPTEAEWEFAARGPEAMRFPWGGDAAKCARAVMRDERGAGCGEDGPRPVKVRPGSYPNFRTSFMHVAGNVWEWTADYYAEDAYAQSASRDPTGPATGTRRVLRGGGWTSEARELRAAYRASADPAEGADDVGLRCAAPGDAALEPAPSVNGPSPAADRPR